MKSAVLFEEKARSASMKSNYESALEEVLRERNKIREKVSFERKEIKDQLINRNSVASQPHLVTDDESRSLWQVSRLQS